jgi:hypothetical protein
MQKTAVYYYRRWLIQAVGGLVTIGAGLSLAIDAGSGKATGQPWFWYGTAALVVFNSGICLVADAVLHRVRYEQMKRDTDNRS